MLSNLLRNKDTISSYINLLTIVVGINLNRNKEILILEFIKR